MKKIIFALLCTGTVQSFDAFKEINRRYEHLQFVSSAYKRVVPCQTLTHPLIAFDNISCNSLITLVKDSQETLYVIKQTKYTNQNPEYVSLLCELVALEMAESLGISMNRSCLMPAGVESAGKVKETPALILSYAPGVAYSDYQGSRYQNIYLAQWELDQVQTALQGCMVFKLLGLTRDLIYHISRNNDLAGIAALDTYVGNVDRSAGNFFYDQILDRFTGIDMGAAFCCDLCEISINNLALLRGDTQLVLTKAELFALKKYKETLSGLQRKYPATKMCELLEDYAHQAGLFDDQWFSESVQNASRSSLEKYKRNIRRSSQFVMRLIEHIDALLSSFN